MKLNEYPGHYQIMYELGAGFFAAKMMNHALFFANHAVKARPLVCVRPQARRGISVGQANVLFPRPS